MIERAKSDGRPFRLLFAENALSLCLNHIAMLAATSVVRGKDRIGLHSFEC